MIKIQAAGTNGKGSTCHYLANILSRTGVCGLFTSPHIFDVSERIRIINSSVMPQIPKITDISHDFGILTCIAHEFFIAQKAGYAVFETGLGGRLDPVSALDNDILILTNISKDHTHILGEDLQEIAREKAGAVRQNQTVFTCEEQEETVIEIIKSECARKNATLNIIKTDSTLKLKNLSDVQKTNASLAIACAKYLSVEEEIAKRVACETVISFRCEKIGRYIFDVCHNEASAKALADTVIKYFGGENILLISSVMRDKDFCAMAKEFLRFATHRITVNTGLERELASDIWAKTLNGTHLDIYSAKEFAKTFEGIIVVVGSFSIVKSFNILSK